MKQSNTKNSSNRTKKKNAIRKHRFFQLTLPRLKIKDDVRIKKYEHFLKIFHEGKTWDYYPGAQRLFDITEKKWHNLELQKFIESITK